MPVRPSAVTNRCCPGRRARIIAALGIEGAAHGEASVTVRQVTSHPHASARNAVSPARAGPGRRWIGRLILGLLGLVLALATAEVALRVLGPRVPALGSLTSIATFQTYHPVYGFFHRPGAAGWIHTPEFTSFVQINSRGLREREIEPARPPGTRRILVLGDSFVEGAQVPAEHTLSRRLEEELRAGSDHPVQTINAGNAGFGTAQELLFLDHDGRAYGPDLVVLVYFVDNDLSDNGYAVARARRLDTTRRPFFVPDGRGGLEPRPPAPPPADPLAGARAGLRQLMLFNLAENVVLSQEARDQERTAGGKDRGAYADNPEPAWQEAWTVTEALLARTGETTRDIGAELVVVVAPSYFQVDDQAWQRHIDDGQDRRRLAIDAPSRRLRAIADRHGLRLLDLLPSIRPAVQAGAPLYFPDDGHWTSEGHAFAARQLAEYLRSVGLAPIS